MFNHILVPLDGSHSAELSLGHARVLATAFESEVHLMRVLVAPQDPAAGQPMDPVAWRMSRARAEGYLNRKRRGLEAAGVRASVLVREGVPSEAIVGALRTEGYDLVILTDHGQGGDTGLVLGGTAGAVALNAPSSILLVPRSVDRSAIKEQGYREILAPVDGSPRCDWAIGVAGTIARRTGARLHLLHVLARPDVLVRSPRGSAQTDLLDAVVEVNRREARHYLEQMQSCFRGDDFEPAVSVVEGKGGVARTIEVQAVKDEVDLIIVSAHGGGDSEGWPYGSVTERLLLSSVRPILVLQDHTSRHRAQATVERTGALA